MAKVKKVDNKSPNSPKRRPSSRTPEGEEKRMVSLAYRLAAKQLEEGTASSQVITHFLKLGTEREKLERTILQEEVRLKKAKTEQIESMKRIEELYTSAIKAMKVYSGDDTDE